MVSSFSDNPARPSTGTSGKPISVDVNIFPIRAIAEMNAFQYDIKADPDLPSPLLRKLWEKMIVDQLRSHVPEGKKALFVFDGKKNAFSTVSFGEMGKKVDVTIEYDRDHIMDPTSSPRKNARLDTLKLEIKQVAKVTFHDLLLYSKGQGPYNEAAKHANTCLTAVLHYLPSIVFTPVGSNFFTEANKTQISGGLEVWRGYHQSIRALMAGHLGLNVDIASTVFLEGGCALIDIAAKLAGCRDKNDLTRRGGVRLTKDLKGVNVVTNFRADRKQRFRIGSVSDISAQDCRFECDGVEITMVEYFKKTYDIDLRYPHFPVIYKQNKKTGFPMELLNVEPGQKWTKNLTGAQKADQIKATAIKPQAKKSRIDKAMTDSLKIKENPYLEAFGLEVSTQMMRVPARVLPAPTVVFADNRTFSGRDGSWNLKDNRLCSAPPLTSMAFVFFVRVNNREGSDIRDSLLTKWAKAGVNLQIKHAPVLISNPNQPNAVTNSLKQAFMEANSANGSRCQMIVCIIDKEPKSLYEDIKKVTLTEAGVLSQCLQFRHVQNARGIKDQYAANVAMKVNIKLGGATNYVDTLPGFNVPTMLVGADVSHGGSFSTAPSVAAIVTSMDRNATRYNTFLRCQGSRVELIADMESVIGLGLDRFKEAANVYPERIICFRDGVDSNQFSNLRNQEVAAIKRALKDRGIEDKCQILYIVVLKRHKLSLFPTDQHNEDRSGNCRPGTVIDTDVVHPFEYNFILQSQSGLQGTSRPSIYHVIYDEIQMPVDVLQQLCFNLCFLSERATRSIKIAAPVYRAHLAADYGRMFIDHDGSDVASIRSGDNKDIPIKITNVTDAISRTMYYM